MRLVRALFAPLLLALLVASCGSEEGLSDEEQELADAFATTLEDDEDGFGVPREDAECMGDAVMTELGMEPFDEAGVTPEDVGGEESNSPGELLGDDVVSEEQAETIIDEWEGCLDLPKALAESAAADFELDEEAEACLADGLAEDDFSHEVLVPSFTTAEDEPSDEVLNQFLELLESCGGGEDGGGGPVVDAIAEIFASGGTITQEQAQCLAQAVLDEIGIARLAELEDLAEPSPEMQAEILQVVQAAAPGCDVPPEALGG